MADSLQVERFIIGGISLGAGTAIKRRRPPPAAGVRARTVPARLLDRPQDVWNREVYSTIADLLETCADAGSALEQFTSTPARFFSQVRAAINDFLS